MTDEQRTPNIQNLLMAYGTVVNRVSLAVLEGKQPDMLDVPLLQALSAAVRVLGSEFNRNVQGAQIQAASSPIVQ